MCLLQVVRVLFGDFKGVQGNSRIAAEGVGGIHYLAEPENGSGVSILRIVMVLAFDAPVLGCLCVLTFGLGVYVLHFGDVLVVLGLIIAFIVSVFHF